MSTLVSRALLLSLVSGCSAPGLDMEAGRETGACIDGGCFDDLECLSDVCVAPDEGTDGGSSPGTTPGSATGGSASTSGSDDGPSPTDGSASASDPSASASDPSASASDPSASASDPSASASVGDDSTSGGEESSEGEEGPPAECDAPAHAACDAMASNAFRAMGVNCQGEPQLEVATNGSAAAIGVRAGFGDTEAWDATEGSRFAVIGTGFTTDLDNAAPDTDLPMSPTHCSDDLGAEYDVGVALPSPLDETAESIAANWAASGAFDYTELRIAGEPPGSATSLSFDFAFFSAEYPGYADSQFNDMFVAWVESESWTGNITFDDAGEAITQKSELVSLRDDMGDDPSLAGTCMRGHTGSPWLRTTAPLPQGEEVTVVFAIFDLADSIVDSYAFLDNVSFGCEDVDEPVTAAVE
jgi:hypothetical protein